MQANSAPLGAFLTECAVTLVSMEFLTLAAWSLLSLTPLAAHIDPGALVVLNLSCVALYTAAKLASERIQGKVVQRVEADGRARPPPPVVRKA